MAILHVLRVFVAPDGGGGNPLGVFLAGSEVPEDQRQAVARELAFSETVFVDDPETAEMRIFTPVAEIPFAGHPTVGTAWLLAREGRAPTVLRPPAGELPVRFDGELTYVAARPEFSPPFDYVELDSPAAVDALERGWKGDDTYFWAWSDRDAGRIRARGMYPNHDIAEDEATGSAALALCARLGRAIDVVQGEGSLLHARPVGDDSFEVGGRTELVEVATFSADRRW